MMAFFEGKCMMAVEKFVWIEIAECAWCVIGSSSHHLKAYCIPVGDKARLS